MKKDRGTKIAFAKKALREQLDYDVTGQLQNAGLTFDQAVQYSIALSLKNIADRLEGYEMPPRGRS